MLFERNLVHGERQAGAIGAIDNQCAPDRVEHLLFPSVIDNVPPQHSIEDQSMLLVRLDVNISTDQRFPGQSQIVDESFAGFVRKSAARHDDI